MEDRTQIKFSGPDIDGSTKPQLITLEQETPIEGTGKRENGETFTYHKWLCTGAQYFMASESLDGMLKMISNKAGKVLKIEKVENPKGGFPFFQINGMNRDVIIAKATETGETQPPIIEDIETAVPTNLSSPPPASTEGSFVKLEHKLDKIIEMLLKRQEPSNSQPQGEDLPF